MREIARSIQIGAKAYLSRQFRTVAVFMAVHRRPAVLRAAGARERRAQRVRACGSAARSRSSSAPRFSAITGYVGMWLAVRANVRPRTRLESRACAERCGSRSAPAGSRGCSPSGSGSSARPLILLIYQRRRDQPCWSASGSAARCSRCSCGSAAASSPRRADVGADLVGKVEAGHPRGRPAQRRDDRRQRGRQRRRLRRDGGRPVRVLRGHAGRVADPGRGGVQRHARSGRSPA
mgnify:CR=1 FL=1